MTIEQMLGNLHTMAQNTSTPVAKATRAKNKKVTRV